MSSVGYFAGQPGRPPKKIESFNNFVAYRMFAIIGAYINKLVGPELDAPEKMSPEKLKEAAEFIKPFALKAMPEKVKLEVDDSLDTSDILRVFQSLESLEE